MPTQTSGFLNCAAEQTTPKVTAQHIEGVKQFAEATLPIAHQWPQPVCVITQGH